ncbi:uncharacterized protein LOC143925721 [Lithobates pipiens]
MTENVGSLQDDLELVTGDKEKANVLRTIFSSVHTKVNESAQVLNEDSIDIAPNDPQWLKTDMAQKHLDKIKPAAGDLLSVAKPTCDLLPAVQPGYADSHAAAQPNYDYSQAAAQRDYADFRAAAQPDYADSQAATQLDYADSLAFAQPDYANSCATAQPDSVEGVLSQPPDLGDGVHSQLSNRDDGARWSIQELLLKAEELLGSDLPAGVTVVLWAESTTVLALVHTECHFEILLLYLNILKLYIFLLLLQFPSNPPEWMEVANKFKELWNFPNCGGAIDGKHVRIVPPPNSGSYYFNYKGFYSIIMLAVVDAKYNFLYLDIGKNGRNSDGSVIQQTEFYHRLQNGTLNLPTRDDTFENMNFVFVADDAFALSENVLKPFPMRNLTPDQRIFNYRLSRARRVVENAFGILANRFRLFLTSINMSIPKMDIIVLCCCVLHNYFCQHSPAYSTPSPRDPDTMAVPNVSGFGGQETMEVLTPLSSAHPRLPTLNARQCRLEYLNYFSGIGAVPWQSDI